MRRFSMVQILLVGFLAIGMGVAGLSCTKKPNEQELSKLEMSRSAAESAERKLAELRQERIKLENELQAKQGELQGNQQELDSLNSKAAQ